MFKKLFKNKSENKIDGFDYENYAPKQAFVKDLEKKFLERAVGVEHGEVAKNGSVRVVKGAETWQNSDYGFMRYLKLQSLVAVLLLATILFVGGFGFLRVRNSQIAAATINEIYAQNPQTALLPMLVAMRNNLVGGEEQALNLASVSVAKKEFYGSETTLEFTFSELYKEYSAKCKSALPLNLETTKIITYELLSENGYTFKTHTFNAQAEETDLLVFNQGTYHSVKHSKIISEEVVGLPLTTQSIYDLNAESDKVSWKSNLLCQEENLALSTILIHKDGSKVMSYSVFVGQEEFYKVKVTVKSLTTNELIKLDEIFNSKAEVG